MMKLSIPTDCGNSPKNEFLKQINIAFATGDVEFLIKAVVDKFEWQLIGDKTIKGKEAFELELNKMKEHKVAELIVDKFFSHGKEGAARGTMIMENGKKYVFADFYNFSSTKGQKLSGITSYIVEI